MRMTKNQLTPSLRLLFACLTQYHLLSICQARHIGLLFSLNKVI